MTVVIDYGVGNLFSLRCSFAAIGQQARVSSDADEILRADRIVLPGVGAFGDAADKLRSAGLWDVVKDAAAGGKPLLGICLGMQLLFDESLEFGRHEGLGLIPGSVRPIADVIPAGLDIPHMGWNALIKKKDSRLLARVKDGEPVYFVHSFAAFDCEAHTVATAEYGAELTAAVERGNVFGTQFHPEKSSDAGLDILREFCSL